MCVWREYIRRVCLCRLRRVFLHDVATDIAVSMLRLNERPESVECMKRKKQAEKQVHNKMLYRASMAHSLMLVE